MTFALLNLVASVINYHIFTRWKHSARWIFFTVGVTNFLTCLILFRVQFLGA